MIEPKSAIEIIAFKESQLEDRQLWKKMKKIKLVVNYSCINFFKSLIHIPCAKFTYDESNIGLK